MLNLMYNLVRFSVISVVCIQLVESEEAIVVNEKMSFWFKSSYKIDGTGEQWTNPSKESSEFSETSGSADNNCWMITKHIFSSRNGSGLVYIDIEIELFGFLEIYVYRSEKKPEIPSISPFGGNKTIIDNYLKENFNLINSTTIPKEKAKRITRTFTFNQNGSKGVTFGIKSMGANGKIWSMKMYYYYCKKIFLSSVEFPKTFSPATGSRIVNGSCSMHSLRADNMSELEAFCLSDGTWRTNNQSLCFCLKGYEPSKDRGCSACAMNFVKPDNSNANCIRCPPNSHSNRNRTLCQCEKGFFRPPGTSSTRCYAPPKMDRKPEVHKINNNNVNISWWEPKTNYNLNESITYDVECFLCSKDTNECSKSCVNEEYSPSAQRLTLTFVVISNLNSKHSYVFRVYPKNSLNKFVPKKDWNYTEVMYTFSGPTGTTSTDFIPTPAKNSKDGLPITYIFIVGAASFLVLMVALLVICILRRKKMNKEKCLLLNNTLELPSTGHRTYVDPTNYENPEDAIIEFACELNPSTIQPEMLIGGGEFGDVYKGVMLMNNGQKVNVAIKTLKHDATPKSQRDFLLEASVMGQFSHPNVVRLEGVIMKSKPRMIVLEFMANGSLDNFLRVNNGRLSLTELITMARCISSGMEYLSGINFVHRDIAARNILVGESTVCKISDFGLSRQLETSDSSRGEYATTGGKIPIRWSAPEAVKYRKFSSASDVWSYGILLWEIMSFGVRPYDEWDNFKVIEKLDEGFRLPAPLDCPMGVHDLMLHCWKANRGERPNFTSITLVIDGWLESPDTMENSVIFVTLLGQWLKKLKMVQYTAQFTAAGYEKPSQLFGFNEEDLKGIGITLVGHRNKIMKGIRALRTQQKKRQLQREFSVQV